MLNNQIYLTDRSLFPHIGRGAGGQIDARELPYDQWSYLARINRVAKSKGVVQCFKCWSDHGDVQWLKTYDRGKARIVSHHADETRMRHKYEAVETPEHKAWNERARLIGEPEGYSPRKEAWSIGLEIRNDVLFTGPAGLYGFEHQNSPFGATGPTSVAERDDLIRRAGRIPMWHARKTTIRGDAPIVRTPNNDLPPEIIENPNYDIGTRSGVYKIERIAKCDGYYCPNSKSFRAAGCGRKHLYGELHTLSFDDWIRRTPAGFYMPIYDTPLIITASETIVRFFWVDAHSYRIYQEYTAALDPTDPLNGAPLDEAQSIASRSQGHSSRIEKRFQNAADTAAQTVDLATLARWAKETTELPAAPIIPRPVAGVCSHWIGAESQHCETTEGVRRYLPGFRCPAHTPRALQGLPEIPPGPGWPIHRRAEQ